jgi:hypothetical protein
MEKMYLVCYSCGSYEDYRNITIFVTKNLRRARSYRAKFNRILRKWNDYYSQFTGDNDWIKNEYIEKYYDRWHMIRNINRCFIDEVEVRW